MSKEQIIQKLLEEKVEPGVKYHTPLPGDISQWYVYTGRSGHRILCVLNRDLPSEMTQQDYEERLMSAPVKTVLRGYTIRDGFIIVDAVYDELSGFITETEDREFSEIASNQKYTLTVVEPYLPGVTNWPEAVEYNYFSNNHELRFFLKNPTRYVTEVIRKIPLQLGFFLEDDIIFFVYRFTDYKRQMVPVNGYSPFSIHLVPDNLRTVPEVPSDTEQEDLLRIHLIDAGTGILKAARTVTLSGEFSASLRKAIIEQNGRPLADDYNQRIQRVENRYPGNDRLMDHCLMQCPG